MQDLRVTVASLRSVLADVTSNLRRVQEACDQASREGSRMILLPELMLTGHGGHPSMVENAETVPDGRLCQEMLELSARCDLCICVGMAELSQGIVYNAQIVADRGRYLGLQRKINLSGDEYCHFGTGQQLQVFELEGDEGKPCLRFGVVICYDNLFPELALLHSLRGVDLIVAPHAARTGAWPVPLTAEFRQATMRHRQEEWERIHVARAYDHNVYVLLCNAVGPSTAGLDGVIANHAGTVMGIDPSGEVFLRSEAFDLVDEVVTVDLEASKRRINHGPPRNRRLDLVARLFALERDRRMVSGFTGE